MVLVDPTQSDHHCRERDNLFIKVRRVLQGLSQLTTKMERKTNKRGEQYGPYYVRFCQGGSCIIQEKTDTINQLYTSVSDGVLNALRDRLVEARKDVTCCIELKNYKKLKNKIDQYEQMLQPPIHMFKLCSANDDDTDHITVQIGVNEKWCCEVETEDEAENLMLQINGCLEPLKEQGHKGLENAWKEINGFIIEHDLY